MAKGGRREREAKPKGNNEGREGRTGRAEGAGEQRRKHTHTDSSRKRRAGDNVGSGNFLFLALIGDPTQSGWKRAQIKRLECRVESRAG